MRKIMHIKLENVISICICTLYDRQSQRYSSTLSCKTLLHVKVVTASCASLIFVFAQSEYENPLKQYQNMTTVSCITRKI